MTTGRQTVTLHLPSRRTLNPEEGGASNATVGGSIPPGGFIRRPTLTSTGGDMSKQRFINVVQRQANPYNIPPADFIGQWYDDYVAEHDAAPTYGAWKRFVQREWE